MSEQTNKDNLPTIDIKGSAYVLVKDRINHFNETYKNGSIRTKLLNWDFDEKVTKQWIVRAVVTPDVANPKRFYTGLSQAVDGQGMVNKTAALENAETSAVGRALAMMGIGVIDSIASADEMRKAGVGSSNRESVQSQNAQTVASLRDPQIDEVVQGNPEPVPWETPACEACGSETVHKTGTSAKTGKEWSALFCSSGEKSHAKFL